MVGLKVLVAIIYVVADLTMLIMLFSTFLPQPRPALRSKPCSTRKHASQ